MNRRRSLPLRASKSWEPLMRGRPLMIINLDGLSPRQIAVEMWKRMEERDVMTWAAAVVFYATFATVPFLAIVLVVLVLRLPDLSAPAIGQPASAT